MRRLRVCDREVNSRSHIDSVPAGTDFLWYNIRRAVIIPRACRLSEAMRSNFHGVPSETARAHYTIKRRTLYGIITAERILYHIYAQSDPVEALPLPPAPMGIIVS